MLLDLLMPLFNFFAPEVRVILSDGCFSFWYEFNAFDVDNYICTPNNLHTIWWALTSSALFIAAEDVYNTNKTSLFIVPIKQDKEQGKVRGHKIQKDRLTLALVVNTTCTDKLKPVIIYKSLCPRCFGRWLPTDYVWWFANQTAWMTSNVFEIWMMSLNVHFESKCTFNYGKLCYSFP